MWATCAPSGALYSATPTGVRSLNGRSGSVPAAWKDAVTLGWTRANKSGGLHETSIVQSCCSRCGRSRLWLQLERPGRVQDDAGRQDDRCQEGREAEGQEEEAEGQEEARRQAPRQEAPRGELQQFEQLRSDLELQLDPELQQ